MLNDLIIYCVSNGLLETKHAKFGSIRVLLKKSERFLQYVLEWIEISSPQEPIIFKESSTFTSSSTRAEAMAIRYIIKKIFDIYWLLYSKFRIVN
ncbi:unnamed protein product [Rhizophagus irregularis]|nr:unnamed protein product [Rhizophagus irregularis]